MTPQSPWHLASTFTKKVSLPHYQDCQKTNNYITFNIHDYHLANEKTPYSACSKKDVHNSLTTRPSVSPMAVPNQTTIHTPATTAAAAGSATAIAQPTSGSQTITQTPSSEPSATLRLRGASPSSSAAAPRVQWAESVIDNEHMGKKSSKVCCIYHAPHESGESSSDDSSSSSGEDSDGGQDLSRARKAGSGKGKGKKEGGERKPSPNAYERVPKHKGKGKAEG